MASADGQTHLLIEDSDNESYLDDDLLNQLPSMSDEDIVNQRHVPDTDNEENNTIPTLPPMINVNNVSNPEDMEESVPHSDIQNLRSYLQTQCYDGCQWTSPLTFEGSLDKRTFQGVVVNQ